MRDTLDDLERLVDTFAGVDLASSRGSVQFDLMLREAGFDFLGSGGTRAVVAIDDDRVAKIDYSPEATTNYEELSIWEEFGSEVEQLNPIYDTRSDGRILVMPRASVVFDKKVPRKYRKELEAGKEILREILPNNVDFTHDFNWGVVDGLVKCIDYAS
jgi:hypothetical protein